MTFVYPAVFTPKKDGKGYDAYFPDLECCEAEGPDLEDAVENAREAAYNWISLELEEEGDLPAQTHIDDEPAGRKHGETDHGPDQTSPGQ